MDNNYLQELISETEERGGGLLLSYQDKPAAVVLSIDKYNQLLGSSQNGHNTENLTSTLGNTNTMEPRNILVTGGAGYIGSHLARLLLKEGYKVIILDNLSAGKRQNIPAEATFVEGDLSDTNLLRDLFNTGNFYAVMHMAASVEVEESVSNPEKYFNNNTLNTQRLLSVMAECGVKNIIFSSTAAVYGTQEKIPISEKAAPKPNNPYGASKLVAEKIIKYYAEYMGLKAVVFRYFNACGCDFDGTIVPTHETHLIPVVLKVAKGIKPHVLVNGTDYQTFDGTCVRDFVHVLDIAGAHVAALSKIEELEAFQVYNIGTGRGSSVMEIINTAAEVINRIIPMEVGPRRPGDAAATVADNAKIRSELGFELKHSDLETIISTSWKQINNL